jgi:hypothetical protein
MSTTSQKPLFTLRNFVLTTATFSIPILIYTALHKRRLERLYPLESLPPAWLLECSPKTISTLDGKHIWNINHVDAFSALVPAKRFNKENYQTNGPSRRNEKWAVSFWTSWPIQLETLLFSFKKNTTLSNAIPSFENGSGVVNGLFHISRPLCGGENSSHNHNKLEKISSSPICATYILPSSSLIGGCHVLAVENIENEGGMVKLWFISEIALKGEKLGNNHDMIFDPPLSPIFKLMYHFHLFYARILMDCGVRNIVRGGEGSE